jgi:uncharacterized protein YndB with AHSA1/START domain
MDILHDFYIKAPRKDVFSAISKPQGLNKWWTKTAAGTPEKGSELVLGFGPDYDWRAVVTKSDIDSAFEFKMTKSDSDWDKSLIGFSLEDADGGTQVRFYHKGWPQLNEHFRISSYCWAMYLRLLKMNLENGLVVPYEQRLEV